MKAKFRLFLLLTVVLAGWAVTAWFLLRDQLAWFLLVEVVLLGLAALVYRAYRRLVRPLDLLDAGTAALNDQDFSTRFLPVGSPDVDRLIAVYNRLIDNIREERVAARRNRHLLDTIIQTAGVGLVILDFDGGIATLNPWIRDRLGLTPDSPAPAHLRDIDHPLAAELNRMDREIQIITLADNRRYHYRAATFVDRGFLRRYLILQDLTTELLTAKKEAYGRVIRMMAHEVNNSIGATNSLLHQLHDAVKTREPDAHELLAANLPVVIGRGERMNGFMQNFARVIRLPQPVFVSLDLNELVGGAARQFRARCERAGVELSVRLTESPARVRADAGQLEQVLINALTNALESLDGGERGQITLSVTPAGFGVADNGPGIPPESAELIFTPFFSTRPQGQGIGLTICRDILERHAARYSLRTDPDGWTRLRVEFKPLSA